MDSNLTLTMPFENDLTDKEKTSIDEYIDKIYEEYKDNPKELTKLAMEANAAVFSGKARAEKLANQGFLKNLWGNITGENRKIRDEIDRDFAISQYASIKMISKLAQQEKLTFDAIGEINLKLNSLSNQIYNEFNEVYSQMNKMMTMAKIEASRIDKLEKSEEVFRLFAHIEYNNKTLYKDLSYKEKVLYIISSFFLVTKGNYSTDDIMMLKSMMDKIGINPNDKISILSLCKTLISNKKIEDNADKLFEKIGWAKLKQLDDIYIPLLGNLKKLKLLENEEKYIVDSVVEMSKLQDKILIPLLSKPSYEIKDIQLNLLKHYSKNNLNVDLEITEDGEFDIKEIPASTSLPLPFSFNLPKSKDMITKKLKLLENEEKYIVDSVVEMLKLHDKGRIPLLPKPSYEIKDIQLNLLKYYSKNNLNIDLEKENSYFDLSVAIINELSNVNNVEITEEEEVDKKISASANPLKSITESGVKGDGINTSSITGEMIKEILKRK